MREGKRLSKAKKRGNELLRRPKDLKSRFLRHRVTLSSQKCAHVRDLSVENATQGEFVVYRVRIQRELAFFGSLCDVSTFRSNLWAPDASNRSLLPSRKDKIECRVFLC